MENLFNTHGGYFAPEGYLRVNEGGSHEENPNGGVQIGVDNNGTPNLLEEGEPVYNDFVYSDNIRVDKAMAEKYGLPKTIEGKLYSEAADFFVDEAAERPMDSISSNGLNAMLVRLADAQEEQKEIKMNAELEEELSKLSPEELAQLEQLLSTEAAAVTDDTQEVPQLFSGGGSKKSKKNGNLFTRAVLSAAMAENPAVMQASGWALDENGDVIMGDPDSKEAKQLRESLAAIGVTGLGIYAGGAAASGAVAKSIGKAAAPIAKQGIKQAWKSLYDPFWVGKAVYRSMPNASGWLRIPATAVAGTVGVAPSTAVYMGVPFGAAKALDSFGSPKESPDFDGSEELATLPQYHQVDTTGVPMFIDEPNSFPDGGTLRYFPVAGHAGLALKNIFTPPTKFKATRLRPHYPTGQLNAQYVSSEPIDIGMLRNDVLSQGASTVSALRNAGSGPSTSANIIAADSSIGRNVGDAVVRGLAAANQQKMNDIAANNAVDEKLADYSYRMGVARASAMSEADRFNIANNMLIQRLNDEAETQQYNAISKELGYAMNGVGDIGRENMAFNMANGISMYRVNPKTGEIEYNPDFLAALANK